MAKYPTDTHDPYINPTHQVLRNRLGITNQDELDQTEAALTAVRIYELIHNPILGRFDLDHLRQIHKRLFGDIYEWAGELRTVDISKGDTRFAHYAHITNYAPLISNALAREGHLKALPPDSFCDRAGYYLGELNVLHPFREGNGRTVREFIGQIAHEAGYEILWHKINREANIQASIEAYQGDSSGLTKLIRDNLLDFDREAAIEIARQYLGDQIRLEPPTAGFRYEGMIIGQTDRYIVQLDANATDHMVLHPRSRLSASILFRPGQIVSIDYTAGEIGIMHENNTSPQRGLDGQDRDFER